jgi:low affinity Fe/Cu permease
MRIVTDKIWIRDADLNNECLAMLLQNSKNTKEIGIGACNIQMTEDFEIDSTLNYQIRKLGLAHAKDETINHSKLQISTSFLK